MCHSRVRRDRMQDFCFDICDLHVNVYNSGAHHAWLSITLHVEWAAMLGLKDSLMGW